LGDQDEREHQDQEQQQFFGHLRHCIEEETLPTTDERTLEDLCINTIRFLSADAVQNANSGHPGMPMGAAAMAYTLWTRYSA
jgi:hypothetical protein